MKRTAEAGRGRSSCHGGSGSCSHGGGPCGRGQDIDAGQGTCDVRSGDLCRRQGTSFVARTHGHGGDGSRRLLRTELTAGGRGCVLLLARRVSPRHGSLRTRGRSHPRELGARRRRVPLRERSFLRKRAPRERGSRRGRTDSCSGDLGPGRGGKGRERMEISGGGRGMRRAANHGWWRAGRLARGRRRLGLEEGGER